MLLQRILTALVLVPFVVWGVLAAESQYFALAVAIVMLLCAWEWSGLTGVRSVISKGLYLAVVGLLMLLLWLFATREVGHLLLMAAAGIWVGMTIALFLWRYKALQQTDFQPVVLAAGLLLLPAAWLALVNLHQIERVGSQITLGMLVLIWVADSAAYFTGKAFGKHKLAPVLSPGKTLEGLYGAVVAALLWALLLFWYLEVDLVTQWPYVLLLALITTIVSIGGDLFESMVKRRANKKDSGQLLPGHGGVWDRIDSMIASSPVFVTGLSLAGILQ